MAGLDPAIHVRRQNPLFQLNYCGTAWMRGSSPRMTEKGMER
jgi:hypothetical protein